MESVTPANSRAGRWRPDRRPPPLVRALFLAAIAMLGPGGFGLGVGAAHAHEIPRHVTIRGFVRPAGDRLLLVIRVPLEAMRDIEFPLRPGGLLDLASVNPTLGQAAHLWVGDYVRFYQDGVPLDLGRLIAARVSLPTDPSFQSYETALEHVQAGMLDPSLDVPWQQAMLDAVFSYPITSDRARFSIEPTWAHLGIETLTVIAFSAPDAPERVYQYRGDPGILALDPRWHQAACRFVRLGIEHIWAGLDHLLFLLCLVIPVRGVRALIPVVTAFTVAHSITLLAAALGLAPAGLWFPPLIEALIAASIVYMAVENVLGARHHGRWKLAFGFGLIHGFGLSFALRDSLQFAGRHLVSSLLAFNVGVEIGQLAVIAVMAPALALLFRWASVERPAIIVASVLVGHVAWHWMAERWSTFRQFELGQPAVDAAGAAALLRWLAVGLVAALAAWLLGLVFGRLGHRPPIPADGAIRR